MPGTSAGSGAVSKPASLHSSLKNPACQGKGKGKLKEDCRPSISDDTLQPASLQKHLIPHEGDYEVLQEYFYYTQPGESEPDLLTVTGDRMRANGLK